MNFKSPKKRRQGKMNEEEQRSLVGEFFYNETQYREGSASERIVSEMDKLWKKGKCSVTIDSLTSIIERQHPILKETLVSVEGRVKKVVSWAKSKGLLETEGDVVKILPE